MKDIDLVKRAKHIIENDGMLARDTSLALIEQLEAVQRQRDSLSASQEHEGDCLIDALASRDEWRLRAMTAEAEIKRRDDVEAVATRGMPDYEIFVGHKVFEDGRFRVTDMVELSVLQRQQEITRQLAVESNRLSDKKRELVEELKRRDGQKPVAAESRFIDSDWSPCSVEHVEIVQRNPNEWVGYEARLLYDSPVAVPGKVVKLPETYAVSNDRSELVEKSAVMVALDAAGVKWFEGE